MLDTVKLSEDCENKSNTTPTDTASSSSTVEEHPEPTDLQYDEAVLTRLARQLEYYFSKANLSKDTYVETLRQLNDGFVPASILARFAKVKALVPFDIVEAVLKSVEYSEVLQVVSIDTTTGKRAEEGPRTIFAVGPPHGKPLDLYNNVPEPVPVAPESNIQNTIILRDVEASVTEDEVRSLFENSPPILSIYPDVANCWFVTLDTDSRDDMLYVMMQLPTMTLGGDPVRARLKSLARRFDPSAAPEVSLMTRSSSMPQMASSNMPFRIDSMNTRKKKQKKRPKSRAVGNKKNFPPGVGGPGRRTNSVSPGNNKKLIDQRRQPQPDFSEAAFPALNEDRPKKIEMRNVTDQPLMEDLVAKSDAASTATTSSSSSGSVSKKQQQHKLGGYAAALLKAKPANVPSPRVNRSKNKNLDLAAVKKEISFDSKQVKVIAAENARMKETTGGEVKAQPVVITPPLWGGGRSFADVLRKEDTAAVAM